MRAEVELVVNWKAWLFGLAFGKRMFLMHLGPVAIGVDWL